MTKISTSALRQAFSLLPDVDRSYKNTYEIKICPVENLWNEDPDTLLKIFTLIFTKEKSNKYSKLYEWYLDLPGDFK
ncbi:MAG: hypothetical protein KGJ90_00335 [Patescibacteria group bacterium]|nr:hypothetical protein [Patescibacteria group bacterium]